jgi:hypothetical protein
MKRRLVINKPNFGDKGQYVFINDDATEYSESNSVPERFDKFADKDLYTLAEGYTLNEKIIEGNLRYPGKSSFEIEKLEVKNSGVNHDIKNSYVSVYLFEGAGYPLGATADILEDDYTTIKGSGIGNGNAIYARDFGHISYGKHVGTVIKDATIVRGLFGDFTYNDDWAGGYSDSPLSFDEEGFGGAGYTNFIKWDEQQKIHVVVYTKGDAEIENWSDFNRDRRIHVFTIDVDNDLEKNGLNVLEFGYSDAYKVQGGGDGTPAWKVNKLKIRINTSYDGEEGLNLYPDEDIVENVPEHYIQYTGSIQPQFPINTNTFNSDILLSHPSREIKLDLSNENQLANYIPSTKIEIPNQLYNLQTYQTSIEDRQITSAPIEISFDLDISKYISTDGDLEPLEIQESPFYDYTMGEDNPQNTYYKYWVLDWNDLDNKIQNFEEALNSMPNDEFEIIEKQKEGICQFKDVGSPTFHSYATPGIKIIKAICFSYKKLSEWAILPVRWKFIKAKLYLDIPLNQYPDFAEVGGSDYTTIPWPYTTPVIGGTDDNSKYKISLQDTLSGGNMGEADIIDEKFIVDALENDEVGESIRKFDLEQVRYLDSGQYDLTKLLLLNEPYISNLYNPLRNHTFEILYDTSYNPEPDDATYSGPCSGDYGWNENLHPNAVNPEAWTPGYNGGTTNECDGYHAYVTDPTTIQQDLGYSSFPGCYSGNYCVIMRNIENEYQNGWLGISTTALKYDSDVVPSYQDLNISIGTKLTLSWWQMADVAGKEGTGGIFPMRTHDNGTTCSQKWYGPDGWSDNPTLVSIASSEAYVWERKSFTITVDDSWIMEDGECVDGKIPTLTIYLYGHKTAIGSDAGEFGTIWFDDVSLYVGEGYDVDSYSFSEETSVGQIFISDNSDPQLKEDCKLEINCGNLTGKSIEDSSGNSNKGLLIGDYKIKKTRKNRPMRRDSFIKTPKKNNNSNGAM